MDYRYRYQIVYFVRLVDQCSYDVRQIHCKIQWNKILVCHKLSYALRFLAAATATFGFSASASVDVPPSSADFPVLSGCIFNFIQFDIDSIIFFYQNIIQKYLLGSIVEYGNCTARRCRLSSTKVSFDNKNDSKIFLYWHIFDVWRLNSLYVDWATYFLKK